MEISFETPPVEDAPKIPHELGTFCYHSQPNKENINYEKAFKARRIAPTTLEMHQKLSKQKFSKKTKVLSRVVTKSDT